MSDQSTSATTTQFNLPSSAVDGIPPPTFPRVLTVDSQRIKGKYGNEAHVVYHQHQGEEEEWKPQRIRELVRPPMVRQWVEAGKIFREPSPREVPRFELFFDLLFVAIIHQLADAAIEEPGGGAVARFVLTFWPSWSIWEEARKYSNSSGTDDLLHRFWVLIGMITLLGYSANASAIELHPHEEEADFDHHAIRAAAAFWLIIKLSRLVVLLFYGWRLPLFRMAMNLSALAVSIPMSLVLPLIWVTSRPTQITLAALLVFVDLFRLDLITINLWGRLIVKRRGDGKMWQGLHRMPALPEGVRIPAMNIEHAIDRMGAFVVIVPSCLHWTDDDEQRMNLVYTAGTSDLGASAKYGKAVLGLMVAWALNYMYMIPYEPNCEYEHALRRSWFSGICFTFFHWPLCASLILASAACGRMVSHDEVETGVHWYWGCGLGFALLFMTLIDLSHLNLAPNSGARVPRPFRTTVSLFGALALILFPFGVDHLTSTAILATTVAITWFVLAILVIGILPRPGNHTTSANDTEGGVERGGESASPVGGLGVNGEHGVRGPNKAVLEEEGEEDARLAA
ncbi:hypothetical protein IAR55_005548 [Kwoniella newhampshirensis]|uniref:Uncharacterized protein n=1 Tax=Kwoniella newhampshirensis TaxID=1651941 RepID=A0AAW0YMJ2_9TREE